MVVPKNYRNPDRSEDLRLGRGRKSIEKVTEQTIAVATEESDWGSLGDSRK